MFVSFLFVFLLCLICTVLPSVAWPLLLGCLDSIVASKTCARLKVKFLNS